MTTQGTVFNIQKFSIHDGPGIRTTVFLKGCPLACKWCSNPESQSFKLQVLWNQDKCVHCQRCLSTCPNHCITMDEQGKIHIDHQACKGCKTCVSQCHTHALTMEGEKKTVDEIVEICMQDLDFYEESGGGVTISGGEGMSQPEFTAELLDALHEKGIRTAIETTGFVKPEIFQFLAKKLDLILMDMKHWKASSHKQGTGQSNELILQNMKWARENNLNLLVRIPVIPGFNDSLEDAREFAKLLKSLGIDQVQLLCFHQMGENKYHWLNREYEYENKKALHPEDLTEFMSIILSQDIKCFI